MAIRALTIGKTAVNEIEIVGYRPGAIGKIAELHGTYYSKHWKLGLFFEARVATEMSEFLSRMNEAYDGFWLARKDGEILGSIAVDGSKRDTEGAHLRWFIVAEKHQGLGIGNKLLRKAVEFCKERKFKRVFLWTFAGLDAARHLYEKFGFALSLEQKGNQWGATVMEQTFELVL